LSPKDIKLSPAKQSQIPKLWLNFWAKSGNLFHLQNAVHGIELRKGTMQLCPGGFLINLSMPASVGAFYASSNTPDLLGCIIAYISAVFGVYLREV
jgi:hypothetical protein